jgi:hypothetical protein
MAIKDDLNLPLSGAEQAAMPAYRQALRELQCYCGDPVASVDAALAAAPGFALAHLLKAYLHLLGTEPEAIAVARACHGVAAPLAMTDRERGHLAAVGHINEGHWHDAARVLEDVAIDHPHDILALQAGHAVDFFTGSTRMLRDRVGRALPAWEKSMPGYHALLGMQAFGFEEMGQYAAAESAARRAVELEPRDGWAHHAMAHVMEMEGRQQDGIDWMRANQAGWSGDSFFQVHNWWHLALFHLERDQTDEVLALYDGPINGGKSKVVLDMVDASALLWRLYLRGTDLGGRWALLADAWAPVAASGSYAFNDLHAAIAFVGAGRRDMLEAIDEAQQRALRKSEDNAGFTRDVGMPAVAAIRAFGAGDYADCIRRLRPIRNQAQRFGGSHAQRDLIDLTLIEAALRDGQTALASALTAERMLAKPNHPSARRLRQRAGG